MYFQNKIRFLNLHFKSRVENRTTPLILEKHKCRLHFLPDMFLINSTFLNAWSHLNPLFRFKSPSLLFSIEMNNVHFTVECTSLKLRMSYEPL